MKALGLAQPHAVEVSTTDTPALTRRFGMHRLLGAMMLALAAGIALRVQPSFVALILGTVIVGAAIGNVVMPPAIKEDFSHRAGFMMGLYLTALLVGAAAASGLTVPMLPLMHGDWRAALAVWSVPAVLVAVVWIPQIRRAPGRMKTSRDVADAPSDWGEPPLRSLLTSPVAIAVTTLMGLQSISYYAALTWVPTILQDAGAAPGTAGWMLSNSAFPGILASLVMPTIAKRLRPTWLPVAIAVLLTAAAYLGLAVALTGATYLWMTLLGLGQGASISLSLTYIVWRSPDTHHTGQLSTMAHGFGYLLAGLGPSASGPCMASPARGPSPSSCSASC